MASRTLAQVLAVEKLDPPPAVGLDLRIEPIMKTVTIRDVRHRWPETEKALAREGEILITRDAKAVAKLVRVDRATEPRPRFDPEKHAAWQRRVGGRRATRWVDAALAEQRADRQTRRGR